MSTRRIPAAKSRRTIKQARRFQKQVESLEKRTMLCGLPHAEGPQPVIEERPDLVGKSREDVGLTGFEPANIVWTNRGAASDGFAARFGAMANQARAVVDAIIDNYEVMIGSFNYSSAGVNYSLAVSMGASGSGFGASAGLSTSLGGKPRSGSITMGAGNGSADVNDDNGWFLDPTPYDNTEFQGNIVNAFSGDAHAGSPAFNKADFFTVVAAEMTHCMGLFGNALAGWSSHTTNTGIADTTAGPGTYWVFDGPSIKHLLTSNNGGGGGGDWGSAVHSSEGPGANINFNGINWIGAQDQGNALYEFGRRYMVNKTFQLMFKDAYGFATTEIANWGTFYSSPFETGTGIVRVRGGAGNSADTVEIFRNANSITVAVNLGDDIPGTSNLPGAGNLPAWVHVYDINSVSQIIVDTGGGDDNIFIDDINFDPGQVVSEPIVVNGGTGNDSVTIGFFAADIDNFPAAITFDGGTGTDSAVIYDNGATFSDTYTITNTLVDRVVFGGLSYSNNESVFINAQTGNNMFNISSTAAATSYGFDGRNGNDTFNIGVLGGNAEGVDGPITVTGNNGTDSIVYHDITAGGTPGYTLNNNTLARTSNGLVTYNTTENLQIEASNGNNAIALQTAPATIPALIINANDGNDSATAAISAANIGFGGTFNGGNGTDSLTFNDATVGAYVGLTQNSLNGTSLNLHTYNTTESLVYNAGGGVDIFDIYSVLPTSSMTVNGGGGNDTFDVGGILFNLSTLQGPLTINGGANTDTVNFNDQSASTNHQYRLLDTQFTRDGMANITYGGGTNEIVKITASAFNDLVDITGHDAVSTVTVDAAGGAGDIVLVNSDGSGTAAVHFANTQDLAGLDLQNGGTLIVDAGGNKVIDTDTLTFVGTGKLDLNDNDLIVDYATTSVRAAIQNLINTGRAGGLWTGNGITSTAAKNRVPKNTTLGVLESSEYKAIYGAGATFAGRTIDTTAVLVKYTYYGDADFNGTVNFDDYSRTDGGFNFGRTGWFNGDFDGSGAVTFDDYSLIDLAFNTLGAVL